MKPILKIVKTPKDIAREAAHQFLTLAQDSIKKSNSFTVVLSGGSTPQKTYTLLASKDFAGQIDWEQVHIFWSDERYVPHDHPDSNYRMAKNILLDKIPLPAQNIHPFQTGQELSLSASLYERELIDFFKLKPGEFPSFDLIILGMGSDGHTASLFPHTGALLETRHLAAAQYVEKIAAYRLTLTFSAINHAKNILFIVSGESKSWTLKNVLKGPLQVQDFPSQSIKPIHGTLTWLLDKTAASKL